MNPNRTPPWRWVALTAFLSWNCVGVQRPTTLTVGGDLSYANPEYVSRGCDGAVYDRQTHRQLGLGAHVRYEHTSGGLFMARLRALAAEQVSGEAQDSDLPRGYGLLGAGVAGGFDRGVAGIDLGISLLTDGSEAVGIPYGQLRLGDLDSVWLSATLGTLDPAHFVRLMGLAVGARSERMRLHAGLALAAMAVKPGDSDEGERGITLAGGNEDLAAGLDLELSLLPSPDSPLSLDVGAFVSEQAALRLGMSYRF
ncbi:MAG: hypothetical protein H6702_13145 [Myxococcales bacterium]|nr:hypothetical protein [Myxococcales bacterium]